MSEPLILELEETAAPAAAAPAANLPAVAANSPAALMLAALRENAPLDQIEKMMDLQERWERNEARKAYNDAMAAFKSEAIEIIKRKHVQFQTAKGFTDYKHAELSDVVEAVGPALSQHGFSWSWSLRQERSWIEVTCTLKHRLGHSESVSLGAPPDESGGKNTIQAIVSTKTYLERHTLKAICGVAEKGEDDDGRGAGAGEGREGQEDKVLMAGRDQAMAGTAALSAWWGAIGKAERKRLQRELPGLRRAAQEADQKGAR